MAVAPGDLRLAKRLTGGLGPVLGGTGWRIPGLADMVMIVILGYSVLI